MITPGDTMIYLVQKVLCGIKLACADQHGVLQAAEFRETTKTSSPEVQADDTVRL